MPRLSRSCENCYATCDKIIIARRTLNENVTKRTTKEKSFWASLMFPCMCSDQSAIAGSYKRARVNYVGDFSVTQLLNMIKSVLNRFEIVPNSSVVFIGRDSRSLFIKISLEVCAKVILVTCSPIQRPLYKIKTSLFFTIIN